MEMQSGTWRARRSAAFLGVAVLLTASSVAWAADYRVGQQVQVQWHGQWFKATVIEIGSGSMQGKYKIRYEGYDSSWDEYVAPARIANLPPASAGGPAGHYVCMSYDLGAQQLRTQAEFRLNPDGTYQDLWNKKSGKWSLKAGAVFQFTGVLNNKAQATFLNRRNGMIVFDWGKNVKLDCYRQP
nr:Tudor-knot domain-containing protein [Deinobacterium chartae]